MLLSGPIYEQSSANTDALWTQSVLVTAGAVNLVFRVEDFVYFSGNGAWAARLYYEAASTPAGSGVHSGGITQAGTQQGPFNNTLPVNVSWLASLIPAGQYAFGVVIPSTTMLQGMRLSLYDDVGGFPQGLSYAGGCCHDPMLDLVLAAVRRDFPSTP